MLAAVRGGDLAAFAAPHGYRPFEPVPLWLALEAPTHGGEAAADDGTAAPAAARRATAPTALAAARATRPSAATA